MTVNERILKLSQDFDNIDNLHLFQNAYQIENVVFTHAGIVHKWFVEDFGATFRTTLPSPANARKRNALQQVGNKYNNTVSGIFMAGVRELYEPLRGFLANFHPLPLFYYKYSIFIPLFYYKFTTFVSLFYSSL